jgi:hypothetical protein
MSTYLPLEAKFYLLLSFKNIGTVPHFQRACWLSFLKILSLILLTIHQYISIFSVLTCTPTSLVGSIKVFLISLQYLCNLPIDSHHQRLAADVSHLISITPGFRETPNDIFLPLALQPQFGPWPTSMKLSVWLRVFF